MQESTNSYAGDCADTLPVSLSVLEESTEGDEELRNEMIEAFLSDMNKSFTTLKQAVAEEDFQQVRAEGHALKGSALYFGADRFERLAENLEQVSKRGDKSEIESAIEDCQIEYRRITRFFEALLESEG